MPRLTFAAGAGEGNAPAAESVYGTGKDVNGGNGEPLRPARYFERTARNSPMLWSAVRMLSRLLA